MSESERTMDLNQLLYNHQLAKLNAGHTPPGGDRDTYFDLVGYYARRITEWRRANGLSEIGWPRDERLDGNLVP